MDKVRLSHWLLCIIIVFIGIAVGSTLVIGFGFGIGVMIVLQIRREAIKDAADAIEFRKQERINIWKDVAAGGKPPFDRRY